MMIQLKYDKLLNVNFKSILFNFLASAFEVSLNFDFDLVWNDHNQFHGCH